MTSPRIDRIAARVLLVDSDGGVLLFHGFDPADPAAGSWWFTPGGGLDPGEEPADGAARELAEETGLVLPPSELHGPVHEQIVDFAIDGTRYRQREWFFVARVRAWTVDTAGFTDLEQRSVDRHRWWTADELAATTERIYPETLAGLLAAALTVPVPGGGG